MLSGLIISGSETYVCVAATVLGAVDLGYRVILARDAVCSSSDAGHDALLKVYHQRFGPAGRDRGRLHHPVALAIARAPERRRLLRRCRTAAIAAAPITPNAQKGHPMGLFSKDIKTMNDLFVDTLRDIYAENQNRRRCPR